MAIVAVALIAGPAAAHGSAGSDGDQATESAGVPDRIDRGPKGTSPAVEQSGIEIPVVGAVAMTTLVVLGLIVAIVTSVVVVGRWKGVEALHLTAVAAAVVVISAGLIAVGPVDLGRAGTSSSSSVCPGDAPVRQFTVNAIQVDIVYNKYGQHDPQGRMYVLNENKDEVLAQVDNAPNATIANPDPNATVPLVEPLSIRTNLGDCVKIHFINNLTKPASIHMSGLPYDVDQSDGYAVGNNDPSFAPANGGEVNYTFYSNERGTHFFADGANPADRSDPDKNTGKLNRSHRQHGLFGALVVEPKGAEWLDEKTGEPVRSGDEVIIDMPASSEVPDHREFVIFYHDGADVRNGSDNGVPLTLDGEEQSLYTMNYRGDPTGARLREDCPNCSKEELFYSSWVHGDPGGGDLVWDAYVGDPVKFRLVGAQVEESHVHHLHEHRWKSNPKDKNSNTIDSQTVSPGGVYEAEINAGFGPRTARPTMNMSEAFEEGGAGYVHGGPGDVIFHCHLFPHYGSGMWSIMRVHDKNATANNHTATPEKLAPLPDDDNPPADPTEEEPGYPNFIPGTVGEDPPSAPMSPNRTPTDAERAALDGNGTPGDWDDGDGDGDFDPDPIVAGAPYSDPCPPDAPVREYDITTFQLNITYNNYGDFDDTARIYALDKHVDDIRKGEMRPRPLAIRAEVGECVEVNLHNDLPPEEEPNRMTIHIHFVGFDVIASDGLTLGWNYDQGVEPPEDKMEQWPPSDRVDNGTINYRWYADEEGNVFWHDHQTGFEHGMHGVFGGLIVEPQDSTWKDPQNGTAIEAGTQANIERPDNKDFREQVLWYQDFTRLHDADTGEKLNPPHHGLEDQGSMGINYANAPLFRRDQRSSNPIASHLSVHQSPGGPLDSGTLIEFPETTPQGDVRVTYKYCYVADTNVADAHIETVFDGKVVDAFSFNTPYVGGLCSSGEPSTFATHSFTVDGAAVSDQILLNFTNGDGNVEVANVTVDRPGLNTIQPIARHDPVDRSSGSTRDRGTLTNFSEAWGFDNVTVTYKYCYVANTDGYSARISTYFDDELVDAFTFTHPYTGGGGCDAGDPSTFATHKFTVRGASISDFVRFDYVNGDHRIEIADIRVNQETDNAYAFSSFLHGDPQTPILEAYKQDPVRFRLFQGVFEEQHNFLIHGLKWQKEPFDRDSPDATAQTIGVSEQFQYHVEAPSNDRFPVTDYLYGSKPIDDLWNGMWGLFRVWRDCREDLETLSDNGCSPPPEANENLSDPDLIKGKLDLEEMPSGLLNSRLLADTDNVTADRPIRTIPSEGPPPMPGGPPSAPEPKACPPDRPVREYNVTVFGKDLVFNEFDDHDPFGVRYGLDKNVADIKNATGSGQPLVLRANEGDCLRVHFTNEIPADRDNDHAHARVPIENETDWEYSQRASLHPQGLAYNVQTSDSTAVGRNHDSTVAPGRTRNYTWIANDGTGPVVQHDSVHRSHGDQATEGTLVNFTEVQASGNLTVRYKYCYIHPTNNETAYIDTYFDGNRVDHFGFTTPSTGSPEGTGDRCAAGRPFTFATHTFTVQDASISDFVRFDFDNGEGNIEIAKITVTHANTTTEIPVASHDSAKVSPGDQYTSGTLINFTEATASGNVSVTYRYCYRAQTNDETAYIDTYFDGNRVDHFGFTTPYTGGGGCLAGDPSTFATHTFTVQDASISDFVRFDFDNGDGNIEIANVTVDEPDPGLGSTLVWDAGDVRSHRHHGPYGMLIVEPEGSTWSDPETGDPIRAGTRAVIDPPRSPAFREFALAFRDGAYVVNPDGTCPVTFGDANEPCNQRGDHEDQGFKTVNYGTEPFARRFRNDDREQWVFNSSIHGDPATPVLRAETGDRTVLRLGVPGDKPRGIAFHIAGHQFHEFWKDHESPVKGTYGTFASGAAEDAEPVHGAGGFMHRPGDYIWRADKLRNYVEGGMWGIFRVQDNHANLTALPSS